MGSRSAGFDHLGNLPGDLRYYNHLWESNRAPGGFRREERLLAVAAPSLDALRSFASVPWERVSRLPWSSVEKRPCYPLASAAGSGDGQLDTTILPPALGCVVGSDRTRIAKSLRRDHVRLNTLRDQEFHHVFSAFLRQDLV